MPHRYSRYLGRGTCLIHVIECCYCHRVLRQTPGLRLHFRSLFPFKPNSFYPRHAPPHPPHLPESLGSYLLPLCLNKFVPLIHSLACSAILPTLLPRACCVCPARATAEAQLPADDSPRTAPTRLPMRTQGSQVPGLISE
ncbi:hypothetical protein HJG60_009556 [Phyllostomus discolor]|uniref:Uncharacterized protein n=1 Tax=Phyllostomus discolor TaxID=89673 RepID=A0A834DC25_9CHIR|nr:hypothetical protein HJG60_009556 [Phyllostomus discolor]